MHTKDSLRSLSRVNSSVKLNLGRPTQAGCRLRDETRRSSPAAEVPAAEKGGRGGRFPSLERHRRRVDDLFKDGRRLVGFLERRCITGADHTTVGEHRQDQPFEVVGYTVVAPFDKGECL